MRPFYCLLPNPIRSTGWARRGASSYHLERAEGPDGPWTTIGYHLDDAAIQHFPLYHDQSAALGVNYYYQLLAVSESGASGPSEVIGPVRFSRQALIDNLHNVGTLYSSRNIEIQTGQDRTFKEIVHRAYGKRGANIVYQVPGSFLSLNIYAFDGRQKPQLQLYGSEDGDVFYPLDAKIATFIVEEGIYNYDRPRQYTYDIPGGWQFIRIEFLGPASIGRVEVEYGEKVDP